MDPKHWDPSCKAAKIGPPIYGNSQGSSDVRLRPQYAMMLLVRASKKGHQVLEPPRHLLTTSDQGPNDAGVAPRAAPACGGGEVEGPPVSGEDADSLPGALGEIGSYAETPI